MDWENERERYRQGVDIEVRTRTPSAWRFVNLETGQVWRYDIETHRLVIADD